MARPRKSNEKIKKIASPPHRESPPPPSPGLRSDLGGEGRGAAHIAAAALGAATALPRPPSGRIWEGRGAAHPDLGGEAREPPPPHRVAAASARSAATASARSVVAAASSARAATAAAAGGGREGKGGEGMGS
uniref:Uncharacterized protein n=1 Tax=Oryza sativa subsp. japonica TaxID=39947 RepID=Q69M36_ORYSJ|nr:hypothetical protein [Oryza sativa Japonica Group]BAD36379.1 hypothetical protein [Oryza sativa Japonica Group]